MHAFDAYMSKVKIVCSYHCSQFLIFFDGSRSFWSIFQSFGKRQNRIYLHGSVDRVCVELHSYFCLTSLLDSTWYSDVDLTSLQSNYYRCWLMTSGTRHSVDNTYNCVATRQQASVRRWYGRITAPNVRIFSVLFGCSSALRSRLFISHFILTDCITWRGLCDLACRVNETRVRVVDISSRTGGH